MSPARRGLTIDSLSQAFSAKGKVVSHLHSAKARGFFTPSLPKLSGRGIQKAFPIGRIVFVPDAEITNRTKVGEKRAEVKTSR
jgi:hypothetical protein